MASAAIIALSLGCPTDPPTYTVKFMTNGGSNIDDIKVRQGDSITNPPTNPTRTGGYSFEGWYTDNNSFSNPVEFPYTPQGNTTLYANWISFLSSPLRANPVAASTATGGIEVLDYLQTASSKFYLIYVGPIHNIYINTIASLDYNGMTPMSWTRTTFSETMTTTTLTETASKTVVKSNTQSGNASFGFKAKGVNLKVGWNGTWGKTTTDFRSVETSFTEIKTRSDSETLAFTVGNNGEPAGWHRYANYGTADHFFIVETSLDKQELKNVSSIICVRDDSIYPKWDYKPHSGGAPNWDNSPETQIPFPDGFHKNLVEVVAPPMPKEETNQEVIRGNTSWEFNNGYHLDQKYDLINVGTIYKYFNFDDMIRRGYKHVSFNISIEAYGIQWGHGRLWLYSSEAKNEIYQQGMKEFNPPNGSWGTFNLKFEGLPISNFPDNKFVIRYSASNASPFGTAKWKNRNLKIQLKFE